MELLKEVEEVRKFGYKNLIQEKQAFLNLLKQKKTTDNFSECIAFDLAQCLDFPCAQYENGRYKGRLGSMSYNIIEKDSGSILNEGIKYIYLLYPHFNVDTLKDEDTGSYYSLEMIEEVLQPYKFLFPDFLRMMVFDFLIGNSDRHQSNWAIIEYPDKLKFAPLYDNSSSLCAYLDEDMIDSYLGKDMCRWNSLIDTKSKSRLRINKRDKKASTHRQVIEYLLETHYSSTSTYINIILSQLNEYVIHNLLRSYLKEGLSEKRILLIQKFLLAKMSLLQEIYIKEVPYVK